MTFEIKITFNIKIEKKKSPAKSNKGKSQDTVKNTIIINQK